MCIPTGLASLISSGPRSTDLPKALAILCDVASIWRSRCPIIAQLLFVVGSRDDLVKWFRQIPLFSGDHCLQCYHWGGVYIVDMHVQMGRQSSADGAQRISFVAGAIVFEAVEAEIERLLSDDTSEPVALWSALRTHRCRTARAHRLKRHWVVVPRRHAGRLGLRSAVG